MTLLFDIELPFIEFAITPFEERSCEGCIYLKDGECALYSVMCVNDPTRPYYQLKKNVIGFVDL